MSDPQAPMKSQLRQLAMTALLSVAVNCAPAAVRYVDVNCGNPTPPYTNWPTAATNIQDAVDAAVAGDQILVTNGIYQTGGKAVFGTMTNRVAVDKPVALQSVNGPEFTIIQGYQVPGTTNGDSAIRCVYLTNGASLSGFTLTNGATRAAVDMDGGGLWCESVAEAVSNCVIIGNCASGYGGGVVGGMLDRSTLQSNLAYGYGGGGAYGSSLSNCILTGNSTSGDGGGAYQSTLNSCTLSDNQAAGWGGGAFWGALTNCTLRDNLANEGGGASGFDGAGGMVVLVNCTLENNGAFGTQYGFGGGGVQWGCLIDCVLTRNTALYGGGALGSSLIHCTLNDNHAWGSGGGACYGAATNCTFSGNSAQSAGGGAFENDGLFDHCTFTNNSAVDGGGSAFCTLNNCMLTGNSASGAGAGGGTYYGTLTNCVLCGNTASNRGGTGGGAAFAELYNCTLTGNYSPYGGGTFECYLFNCIAYLNTSGPTGPPNYDSYTHLNFCCTTPMPTNGLGNTTNAPLFVDTNQWANLRLQSNSLCINAGSNAYAGVADLDGRPRIQGGTVDIGAYEFQPGVSGEFIGWLSGYGLPTDGSADFSDSDNDGFNNWQEWIAGTVPTDASSVLRLLPPSIGASGILLTWQSVTNRSYFLERCTALGAGSGFSAISSNIVGLAGSTSFTDTNAAGPGPFFYRVGVQQ